MILLWGLPGERPMQLVANELSRLGAPFLFLDQSSVLDMAATLEVDHGVTASVRLRGVEHRLDEMRTAYFRCHDTRRLPAIAAAGPASAAGQHAIEFDDALLAWLDLTPATVVNRPGAMASNNSKPYQLALIAQSGFAVPETLVTSDPDMAAEFWDRHGSVIYKSLSGVRSRVSRLQQADRHRLADVVFCPTQFQEFIAGVDYRIHVVGTQVFGTRIASDADDYRFTSDDVDHVTLSAFDPDSALADRCRALAARLGLLFAGIDLRLGRDGRWVCFEVNPSPAYCVYEDATGQAISAALARLLLGQAP